MIRPIHPIKVPSFVFFGFRFSDFLRISGLGFRISTGMPSSFALRPLPLGYYSPPQKRPSPVEPCRMSRTLLARYENICLSYAVHPAIASSGGYFTPERGNTPALSERNLRASKSALRVVSDFGLRISFGSRISDFGFFPSATPLAFRLRSSRDPRLGLHRRHPSYARPTKPGGSSGPA